MLIYADSQGVRSSRKIERLCERDADTELGAVVADAGYWSTDNMKAEQPGRELFIATKKDHKQRAELRDAPPPRGRIPKTMSTRERMDRKLRTKRGLEIYAQRSQTVEPVFGHPVFGHMKDGQGAGRFSMRGLHACRGGWHLAAVYNLRKRHRESAQRVANTNEKAGTGPGGERPRSGRVRPGEPGTRPTAADQANPIAHALPAHAPGSALYINRHRGDRQFACGSGEREPLESASFTRLTAR